MSKEIKEELQPYIGMVNFLARTLTSAYEIVLFDTTQRDCPVAAQSTRRNETIQCARQMALVALENKNIRERGILLNRPAQPEFGQLMKVSVYLIKGEGDCVIGALCLNMRCNDFMKMNGILSELLNFDLADLEDMGSTAEETEPLYVEPTLDMIDQTVRDFGIEPGRYSPEERQEIMCDLYDLGVFELKGAVARVAEALRMSEQSVYRYLSKIKKLRS